MLAHCPLFLKSAFSYNTKNLLIGGLLLWVKPTESSLTESNQIRVVFMCTTFGTSFIFTKKSNVAKSFFDICNAELAQTLNRLQKSEFLKLIVSLFHYFWCQIWDQWHKMSGKNTHIYFFYFWFKNKQVWAEKIGKKRKNSKSLKVAGNYPYM